MNKLKHIVFLTPGFAASEKDTVTIPAMQLFLEQLLAELPEDTACSLITFQYPYQDETYCYKGIKVYPLNGQNMVLKKLGVWWRAMFLLNKLHKENPISALHSFWLGECALMASVFGNWKKLPHVISAMGQDVLKENWFYPRMILKSRIVTLSQIQREMLLQNFGLDSQIVPMVMKKSIDLKSNEGPRMVDILAVGSLNTVKNYPVFLALVETIAAEKPNLCVEIIGEGDQRQEIERGIKQRNLAETVHLRGSMPRSQVLARMTESKILLHPSHHEALGLVFLEALAAGMHIVSFAVGISKDIQTENWDVCYTKEEMIRKCLARLENDRPYKSFAWEGADQCIQSYIQFYESAV
ncbi:glycosyltransferase [Marinilongibacter aquaticus]|uniref:glycosyltransferase n=1 Tax=Marinilongibacter aquaticus TaxID=2975157 RepID=UPI0021BD453C|nr:glycosyltransferase [Marinilongibacter aquaticus]UBM59297.1 glycosyltransferase [Marinilongibacter aquaticus]